jgi:nucleoside-diphosphate-sugar epimerase
MNAREINILVTGADGFVGTHLCRQLLKKYTVYAFVLPSRLVHFNKKLGSIDKTHLKIIAGEFKNLKAHQEKLKHLHYAIHCAGTMVGSRYSTFEEANLDSIKILLPLLPLDLKRLIFLSSQSAVGPSDTDIYKVRVGDLAKPISFYGETKLLAEKTVQESKVPHVILRPASIFGPEDPIFLEFFKMASRGRFPILGQKLKHFQFVNVFDLISAIELSLFSTEIHPICHIAFPDVVTWDSMRQAFETALNQPLSVSYLGANAARWYLRFLDVKETLTGIKSNNSLNKLPEIMAPYWLLDESEFMLDTGFQYSYPLDTTIEMTLAWYRDNLWIN